MTNLHQLTSQNTNMSYNIKIVDYCDITSTYI